MYSGPDRHWSRQVSELAEDVYVSTIVTWLSLDPAATLVGILDLSKDLSEVVDRGFDRDFAKYHVNVSAGPTISFPNGSPKSKYIDAYGLVTLTSLTGEESVLDYVLLFLQRLFLVEVDGVANDQERSP